MGRISSIEAPVVPIIFEIKAPKKRNSTLNIGVAFLSTLISTPPETINKELKRAIKEIYSVTVCKTEE